MINKRYPIGLNIVIIYNSIPKQLLTKKTVCVSYLS